MRGENNKREVIKPTYGKHKLVVYPYNQVQHCDTVKRMIKSKHNLLYIYDQKFNKTEHQNHIDQEFGYFCIQFCNHVKRQIIYLRCNNTFLPTKSSNAPKASKNTDIEYNKNPNENDIMQW